MSRSSVASADALCALLNARYPIIQAPMAGASSPAMAAKTVQAGCVGSLAAAYLPVSSLEEQLKEIHRAAYSGNDVSLMMRELTNLHDMPVAVNLFVPTTPQYGAERGGTTFWASQAEGRAWLRDAVRHVLKLEQQLDVVLGAENAATPGGGARAKAQDEEEKQRAELFAQIAADVAEMKEKERMALSPEEKLRMQFEKEFGIAMQQQHSTSGSTNAGDPLGLVMPPTEPSSNSTVAAADSSNTLNMLQDDLGEPSEECIEALQAAALKARDDEVQAFEAKCHKILELRPRAFSFVFGVPDRAILQDMKKRGITTIATVTSVEEAARVLEVSSSCSPTLLASSGGHTDLVDVIVAQGIDAGGHRGTFDMPRFDRVVPDVEQPRGPSAVTLALDIVEQLSNHVSSGGGRSSFPPIVAAGGVRTKDDFHEILRYTSIAGGDGSSSSRRGTGGIAGFQVGTPLLTAKESVIPNHYRQALMEFTTSSQQEAVSSLQELLGESSKRPAKNATKRNVTFTRAFSGRWAQGLSNHVTSGGEETPRNILPFPMQNAITRPLRDKVAAAAASATQSSSPLRAADFTSLWVGRDPEASLAAFSNKETDAILGEFTSVIDVVVEKVAKLKRGAADSTAPPTDTSTKSHGEQ